MSVSPSVERPSAPQLVDDDLSSSMSVQLVLSSAAAGTSSNRVDRFPAAVRVEKCSATDWDATSSRTRTWTRIRTRTVTVTGTGTGAENENDSAYAEASSSQAYHETDRHGFIADDGSVPDESVLLPVSVLRKREMKWLEMFKHWPDYMNKHFDKVKGRCRKGIPPSVRAKAWMYMCGAHYLMTNSTTRHLFENLDACPGDPKWNEDIIKDLNRQFPNHELFASDGAYRQIGQKELFRLLKAWTMLHPEEGYCQGQAPVAATLLMQMPVEEAFYCFIQICEKYLPGYYSPGLKAIQMDGDILFSLLRRHSYSTYKHLKKQNVDPVFYMVEWFMCIFCRTLPWPTVLRVWDMFFCEGVKVLFKAAVVIIKYTLNSAQQIRSCPTMYETIETLRHVPPHVTQEETFVQRIIEINISEEELERLHYKIQKGWLKRT